MDYRSIIESKYNRQNWQQLLHDIFNGKEKFWQSPQKMDVDANIAKQALYLGNITLPDGHIIGIYEVELNDKIVIERNRVSIRNLLCTSWRGQGYAGAFMFCYRQSEAVLRFSYVSESLAFTEDGNIEKTSTDTKRFTYLLGEGHRSRTAIEQFMKLRSSALTLKDITKAFSVEALSDMFFNEYKKNYEDIIEYITGKRMVKVANKWEETITGSPNAAIKSEFSHFPDWEKAVRDYVKKFMGRLVFIQFLQKKGWMGCPAGEAWTDGDKEFLQNLFANSKHQATFVDDVLEPLFNDINTKRKDDLAGSWCTESIKIPYLNGGLFENDAYDSTRFPLPAKYIKGILDFFANYNFTIDENDPDDAEIGVDPEMLGRIFENLLEDNKDKGAFYTPKEIVQYMCRESLIAYLQTDIEDDTIKTNIRDFVTTHEVSHLRPADVYPIDKKLQEVKICDPAIGSGAFPMGILRELFACRMAIEGKEEGKTPASIKKDIIQNSIYGVDIEKGAVDIARLRFWLSLIIDETTPHALPNMDFKIMQGNSLLEQYQGVDLSQIMHSKKEEETEYQIMMFEDEVDILRYQLVEKRKEYYNETDKDKKKELRKAMRTLVQQQIETLHINVDLSNIDIAENSDFFLWHTWFSEVFENGGFDIVIANPPYIGVKGHREIFDLIKDSVLGKFFIGKMDYFYFFFHLSIYLLKKSGIANFITTNYYVTADGAVKLRKHLYEETVLEHLINLGEMKLFENAPGQHNMITMFRTNSGKNTTIKCVIMDVHRRGTLQERLFAKIIAGNDNQTKYVEKNQKDLFEGSQYYIRLTDDKRYGVNTILNKIACNNKTIFDICDINQGIVSGADYVSAKHLQNYKLPCDKGDGIFVLDECNERDNSLLLKILLDDTETSLVKRFFKNSGIFKYITTEKTTKKILFIGKDIKNETQLLTKYPIIGDHLKVFKDVLFDKRESLNEKTDQWFTLNRGTSHPEVFLRTKIVCPQRSKFNTFGYNECDWYAASDVFYITNPIEGYELKYILALLNSKLYYVWLYNKGKRKGETLELTATPISEIPIKKPENDLCSTVISLVDRILALKKQNPLTDTSALEAEIDQLVYKLYDLTPEEIEIVENATK